ncbi:hypothetical protein OROHE_005033 [Orobanche hederae]
MERENSKPLATESFSYSWLTDNKRTFPSDDNLSPKFSENSDRVHSFNFDIPIVPSSSSLSSLSLSTYNLVHADEIFSDGRIKPIFVEDSKMGALKTSNSISTPQVSLYSPSSSPRVSKKQYYLLGKWRNSSKKILQKCFEFVRPLCRTLRSSRKSNRVDDLERKVFEVQSWSNSPRPSSVYLVFEWADIEKIEKKSDLFHEFKKAKSGKKSTVQASPNLSPSRSSNVWFDAENSIPEAILYCKRSIEK